LYRVIDTILRSHYTTRKFEITIVFQDFHSGDDQKEVTR
jgi:hypothetical protein